ncbi:LOW QUALITY PROTEIN: hypothetical protein MKX07_001020 [Trichoderma sp. CBMAI-0711]|nr:LOW QUALITY PROTEIN: hypothetical protein MKX07_001020 [Trichoderma sp. CBMAI-0711]
MTSLLHVGGFDVNDVEALILDVEVPEVDAQIVTANERFAITVDGYAVDVVRVGVGVGPSRDGGNDGVMMCETGQLEIGRVPEVLRRGQGSKAAAAAYRAAGRYVVRKIVLGHHFKRLFENLPQLDRLVVG